MSTPGPSWGGLYSVDIMHINQKKMGLKGLETRVSCFAQLNTVQCKHNREAYRAVTVNVANGEAR